ncbi:MAG: twin-arginine translocation signal domain-containing protein [Alphaproteobacteria bacterium]|nr:twin-arginine translocation signal domain-containing protein [Alphaproteobacteria bacterium]
MSKTQYPRRRFLKTGAAAAAAVGLGFPMVGRAQAKTIKVGMPTILSGRVAMLGTSSRNAVMTEVEKFNAAGGLGGRTIEMVIRDSKGQPQEAARVARELVNTDGCEVIFDCEASSGAFAVHEVARDLGVLCLHNISETSALTADPKNRIPNAFRTARQGIHDSIAGGSYAAGVAKAKGIKRWMTCSPDYAYGRDTTAEFVEYLKHFMPEAEVVGEAWPKLFQPDYTEVVTKIVQTKPQALYSCLWGGDLTSFIDQGNLYGLFQASEIFAVNMADYTTLTVVKNLPRGIHSGNRYIKTFPKTGANAAWGDAYRAKYNEYPTNWSWESALGMQFLTEAMKKVNSADGKKIAEALRGMKVQTPFGADGTVTMRAEDQTVVGYAVGWGTTIPGEPYVPEVTAGDWNLILRLEAEWKKRKGFG